MNVKAFFVCTLAVALLAAPAHAASFHVTVTTDAPDADPGDGVCETGPGNGVCTLRAAIQEANAFANVNGEPDWVMLSGQTYTLTIGGSDEDAAASGDLDISEAVIVSGAGVGWTIIDGNGIDRVIDIRPGAAGAKLQMLTVTGGDTTGYGGGILSAADLTLASVEVTGNSASTGGGIRLSGGHLTAHNLDIVDNQTSSQAAALSVTVYATAELHRAIITGNSGGGIIVVAGPTVMTETLVADNLASMFSALYVSADLDMEQCAITGNSLGGLHLYTIDGSPAVNLSASTVSGNGTAGIIAQGGLVNLDWVTVADNVTNGLQASGGSVWMAHSVVAAAAGGSACSASIASLGYNLDSDDSCGLDQLTDQAAVDPLLEELADNGGFTPTHALTRGSPALDGVICSGLVDQRGVTRPQMAYESQLAACDLGALEMTRIFFDGFESGDLSAWQ